MNDDERALQAVLDSAADQNVAPAARQAAERDVAAIHRGILLLAEDVPHPSRRRRPAKRWMAVAAGFVLLVTAALVVLPMLRHPSPRIVVPAPTLTLQQRVDSAERIVVGTVTAVDYGRLPGGAEGETGERYVLATIQVTEAIKGAGGQVVAFSYDGSGGGISAEGSTRPWKRGDHVLLFLVSDAGTVSATVTPAHLQVAGGEAGRYFIDGDRLDGTAFTVEDVRRAAA